MVPYFSPQPGIGSRWSVGSKQANRPASSPKLPILTLEIGISWLAEISREQRMKPRLLSGFGNAGTFEPGNPGRTGHLGT